MGMAKRTTVIVNDINVTPMVDVMLVLLIIFMVVTPMLGTNGVDLPKVRHPHDMPDVNREGSIVVTVVRDGKIFLKANQMSSNELEQKIRDLMATRAIQTVYVKGDARAKYSDVARVVESVRA